MPKEIINDRYLVPNQLTGEGPPPDDMPFLQVGWGRTAKDKDFAQVQVGSHRASAVQLDRDSLNRLIRTLRKARDQAFGSDA